MSMASPDWRNHLLQQAEWIMEILDPDGIVLDESFTGLGYDYRSGKPEAMSPGMITFLIELKKIVSSRGSDRALFSSDCSLGSFILWCDAEGGDHAYDSLLGHELYREPPTRFLSALGEKAWIPCNWQQCRFWDAQTQLAREIGSGIGVSNGWIEYCGLAGLPEAMRDKMIRDINSLFDD
jgi:hypothetical protein